MLGVRILTYEEISNSSLLVIGSLRSVKKVVQSGIGCFSELKYQVSPNLNAFIAKSYPSKIQRFVSGDAYLSKYPGFALKSN